MTHEAFMDAGKKPGLEIWRIENFEPVPYPKKDYGKFYSGDSYIVLSTVDRGRDTLEWNLHFWLGRETSQDEAGSAAIFSVQLDDHLGGGPVQYREVQNHESSLFLSYFKNGVRYLPGGVASGFTHVDPSAPQPVRLFQVKGKKHVRVWQVPVGISSLNKGDCFILDVAPETVYVYQGACSKRLEKLKAIAVANQIRDQDHGGRPEIVVIDEFSSSHELSEFFSALGGGSQEEVPDEFAGGDDDESERKTVVSLHRVSDAGGDLKVTEVAKGELKQEMLDSNDCFILDTSHASLFVWIGRGCSPTEKSGAIVLAQKFIKAHNYPAHTRVQRVIDEGEPAAFRELFSGWEERGNGLGVKRAWHCKVQKGGKLEVCEVFDIEQEDLDEDDVILIDTGSKLFVWLGKDSSEDEKNLSLKKAERMNKFGKYEEIVTVEQNKEPNDFTKYFPNWNPNFWKNVGSYQERRDALKR